MVRNVAGDIDAFLLQFLSPFQLLLLRALPSRSTTGAIATILPLERL